MKKLLFIPMLGMAACATVDYSDAGIQSRVGLADRECGMIGYPADDRLECTHTGYRQITGAAIADVQARNGRTAAIANTAIAIGAAGGL